jgi:ribosomal protein S6
LRSIKFKKVKEIEKLELTLILFQSSIELILIKLKTMPLLRKYEIMILLTEEFNDSELKTWVFNYAKNLRKFSVCDISVISRGKHNLAYPIKNKQKEIIFNLISQVCQNILIIFENFKTRFKCITIFSFQ